MNKHGLYLGWLWRLIMTGLCFAVFGLGGLLLSLIWFNLLLITVKNETQRRRIARKSIAVSFRCFMEMMQRVGVLEYRIEGAETLQQEKNCLIVANHPTLIDYVMLASVMPEVDCMVKKSLLNNPFVSGVIKAAGYLVNDHAEVLLEQSEKRLQRGDAILIFPEGTRTTPGKPIKLQRGAANLAVRCKSDVRVVRIYCSEDILNKHKKWYHVPINKPVFEAKVGQRIKITQFINDTESTSLAARKLNRVLEKELDISDTYVEGIAHANITT